MHLRCLGTRPANDGLDDVSEIINHLDEGNKKLYQEQHWGKRIKRSHCAC